MIDNRDTQTWLSLAPARLLGVSLAAVFVLSLSACFESINDASSDDDDNGNGASNPAERDSGIRFMHVGSKGNTVHVYFDDQRIGSNIGFTNGSGYIDSSGGDDLEGDVEIRLVERSTDLDDEDSEPRTLFSKTVNFDEDTRLSAFIQGEGDDLSLQLVDEHFDGETDASTVYRLSHFAGNKGEVDIYLTSANAGDLEDLSPTHESVSPGSILDFESVNAESAKRLRVAPAGSDEVLFDSGESSEGGVLYFFQGDRIHLVMLDFSGDNLQNIRGFSEMGTLAFVQSVEHTDPAQMLGDARTQIQLSHAVADSEPMDVQMDGEQVASELVYGDQAEPFLLIAGDRTFQPLDSESGATIGVDDNTLSFIRRHEYSVILVGSQQSGEKRWAKGRVSQASQPIDEDEDRIYIHAVNGYLGGPEAVDLVINDVIPGGGYDLEFGEYQVFNQAMPIESADNVIRFYETGTYGAGGEPIAEKSVDVERGESYTAVLVGSPGADPEILMIRHWIFD